MKTLIIAKKHNLHQFLANRHFPFDIHLISVWFLQLMVQPYRHLGRYLLLFHQQCDFLEAAKGKKRFEFMIQLLALVFRKSGFIFLKPEKGK